ncbi:MAG: glycosyltransferase family 9 protein [Vampirovibrionales bacterium]|nr:glycosyltransferase family 9 protein [Vampirovibrionales bacterium]
MMPFLIPQRILLVPLRFVGDMVLTLPLAEGLKATFPNASIGVLASKLNAPLAQTHPNLDEVVIEAQRMSDKLAQLKEWDTVISCRQSWTLAALAKLAGVQQVIGFDRQRFPLPFVGEKGFCRTGWFLDATVSYPPTRVNVSELVPHQVQAQWQLIETLGVSTPPPDKLTLYSTAEDDQHVASLLEKRGLLGSKDANVMLHIVSASASKGVSFEVFAPVCQALHQQGKHLITTGTVVDIPMLEALQTLAGVPIAIVAGRTTLRQVVSLAKYCSSFVGVDSGPVHLAAAGGIQHFTVAYGPTNPSQWGPYGNTIQLTSVHYNPQTMHTPGYPSGEANRLADALAKAVC